MPAQLTGPKASLLSEVVEEFKNLIEVIKGGWKVIGLCVGIFLLLATLYCLVTKKNYKASAKLLIDQQNAQPIHVGGPESAVRDGIDDYIPTHAQVLSSPVVVQGAIDAVGLQNLPCLAGAEDTLDEAILRLTITRPERTAKILKIEFVALTGEEARRMTDAIIKSYKRFLADSSHRNNGQVAELISNARVELERDIKRLEADYLEHRRKNPLPDFDNGGKEAGKSLSTTRLEHWDQVVRETDIKISQLKAQLELGKKLAKENAGLWAVAHAMAQLSTDGTNSGSSLISQVTGGSQNLTMDYVRQLMQEQQTLIERYGPDYAKVKQLQEQITRIQERLRESKSRIDQGDVQQLIKSVEESLKACEAYKSEVAKRFTADLDAAKKADIEMLSEGNIRGELDRNRALFDTLVNQLKQAQFSGDYSSFVAHVVEPAKAAIRPVKPRVLLSMAIALVLGVASGVGVAVVSDRMDPRVRTVEELAQLSNLVVLGRIPGIPKNLPLSQISMGLVSQAMPQSIWAESFRMLRTNVDFVRRGQPAQVLLVTSAVGGEGKTTTASNLAISSALAGRRVLLIDADLRSPSLRSLYKLPDDDEADGLAEILKGSATPEQVIWPSFVKNLDLIQAGQQLEHPAELLLSPQFGLFLEDARRSYELIVIDSSPLLAVTDPSIIGALADGIIFVSQVATVHRHDVVRAVEALGRLGAPILGSVINRVDPKTIANYASYGQPKRETNLLFKPLDSLGLALGAVSTIRLEQTEINAIGTDHGSTAGTTS